MSCNWFMHILVALTDVDKGLKTSVRFNHSCRKIDKTFLVPCVLSKKFVLSSNNEFPWNLFMQSRRLPDRVGTVLLAYWSNLLKYWSNLQCCYGHNTLKMCAPSWSDERVMKRWKYHPITLASAHPDTQYGNRWKGFTASQSEHPFCSRPRGTPRRWCSKSSHRSW